MSMSALEQGTEIAPKSILRFSSKSHDILSLLDLLEKNQIHVLKVCARNPDPDAILKLKKDEGLPVTWSHIEVSASYETVKTALKASDEFREHIGGILGSIT